MKRIAIVVLLLAFFACTISPSADATALSVVFDDSEGAADLLVCLDEYFALKYQDIATKEDIGAEYSRYWIEEPTDLNHFNYSLRDVEANKWLYNRDGHKITEHSVEVTYDSLNLSDDSARVNAYVVFRFFDKMSEKSEHYHGSAVGIDYDISLQKRGGVWRIADIDFLDDATRILKDDPSLTMEEFRKVKEEPQDSNISALAIGYDMSYTNGIKSEPYYLNGINTSLTASYALQYALSYNTLFKDYKNDGDPDTSDCQNFASQCIWYGLGGSNTSTAIENKYLPMVSSGNRAWYQTQSGSTPSTWVWTSCTAFGAYISGSNPYVLGPCGTIYSGIAYARVGDLIQVNFDNDSSYDHVYVVNDVSGTFGQRTSSEINVCAHTTDRYDTSFNYVYNSNYTYRTIHVTGSYISGS